MKKIFQTGLTSTAWGGMEYHNLGNFIIADTMFKLLRENFPDCIISTSMQMSDTFYEKYNLEPLKERRFWTYNLKTGISTFTDICRIILWKIFRNKKLIQGSSLLSEIYESDLIIDFSGDIYGDNAKWRNFLEENARLFFCLMLKKPIAMIIGSPGPFSSIWRLRVAKYILPKLNLVTNREPLSTKMLAYVGIKGDKIKSTVCPSILFEKADKSSIKHKEDYENLFKKSKATIGIIICGWNMPVGPFNKWPREDWEFDSFIKLVNYLLENTNYRICIMSHQNSTDTNGNLIPGNDHRIINHLLKLLGEKYDEQRLFTLKQNYDAAQSKTIISTFEIVISGRIHGAVQALSQGIPSLVLDYGHEPKAHKLHGFARVYGVDDFVCNPADSKEMIDALKSLLLKKEIIINDLNERIPKLKKIVKDDFNFLKEIV